FAGHGARALYKYAEGISPTKNISRYLHRLASPLGIGPVDGDQIDETHALPEDRYLEQFFFCDDAHSPPGMTKEGRCIQIRAVVRNKNILLFGIEVFEARNSDLRAACL